MFHVNGEEIPDWASAIARRIADEWDGKESFPQDAETMEKVLYEALKNRGDLCMRLVGTGVIEEDYFRDV